MWFIISLCLNNNNNNNNNNNGNFIYLFECTIVNLATYRQFTIGCFEIELLFKKKNQNFIKSGLSAKKDVICCSNGYIYHFLMI